MKTLLVLLGYLKWHYGRGLLSLIKIWKNFLFFLISFFSLRQMITNLFDHWKRMADPYPKTFSFSAYLSAFIVNIITRIVGLIMRLFILIIGTTICLSFIALLPVLIIIWLLMPVIIIVLIISGLYLIFF